VQYIDEPIVMITMLVVGYGLAVRLMYIEYKETKEKWRRYHD